NIATDGPATHGGLHTNLVHPAGLRANFKKGAARTGAKNTIVKTRVFCTGCIAVHTLRARLLPPFAQPIFPVPLRWTYLALHQGQVFFTDLSLLELFGQPLRCLCVPREEHDPR